MEESFKELVKAFEKGKKAIIYAYIEGTDGEITIGGDAIGMIMAVENIIRVVKNNSIKSGIDAERTNKLLKLAFKRGIGE